jgi:hypothetical protein
MNDHMSTEAMTLESLLAAFAGRLVQRARPFAVQVEDGSYRWVYADVTPDVLLDHLDGDVTLALSSSDGQGQCHWLCLDVDDPAPNAMAWLLSVRGAFSDMGLPGLVEASRRGGHLWLFLAEPLPVATARAAVLAALAPLRERGVTMLGYELYPDGGAQTPGALGHAVRLPLGVHQLTGKRYPLFDADGQPCAFTTTEAALRFVVGWPEVASLTMGDLATRWSDAPEDSEYARPTRPARSRPARPAAQASQASQTERGGTRSAVIRWVDAHVSPLDLLAQLATDSDLQRMGLGYLSWCPFHDDRASDELGRPGTKSFYVVHDQRYGWSWRCLSTNCTEHDGPMRHSFLLFQRLTGLTAAAAVREAIAWWPESGCARLLSPDVVSDKITDPEKHERSVNDATEHSTGG